LRSEQGVDFAIEIFFYWSFNMNAAAFLFPSVSNASERAQARLQLERALAELKRQDEIERAALRVPVIDQIKKLIAEHGISCDELFQTASKDEPRYQYCDAAEKNLNKRNKTWNGRGTMPAWLIGREKECLIPGKSHTKAIEASLKARAGDQAPTPSSNPETIDGMSPSNVEAQANMPVGQDFPQAQSADKTSTLVPNNQVIAIAPVSNTGAIHLNGQGTALPIVSVSADSVGLAP
jgi:DNA-binding protein H-NS